MTDYVFIQNFRFSKDQVQRLVSLLGLDANDNLETHGNPLTPFLQVCIALLTFAEDNRQRILEYVVDFHNLLPIVHILFQGI